MTRLDEFLEPLHHGVWEVAVPKDSVTEPLDSGWEKSKINVPSPGTIDSYRKGQYHVHETATEWRVHLDRGMIRRCTRSCTWWTMHPLC
jgi:hypothetical protein